MGDQAVLESHGITCSMSRRGNCYDNLSSSPIKRLRLFGAIISKLATRRIVSITLRLTGTTALVQSAKTQEERRETALPARSMAQGSINQYLTFESLA
jgi:hypothetical protein